MTREPAPQRRYDLDWLRIIAFGLLIFYHVGMFYVTWDFHVKSDRSGDTVEPLMLLVNPWRLELLFFISGVAARFMLDKTTVLRFAGSRFNRLFWPLVFGMLVIVPPQTYEQLLYNHIDIGVGDFYLKYVTAYPGWVLHGHRLIVPTWNHLWYVAYLLVYCLILALIWPVLKRLPLGFLERLPAWAYFVGPFAIFWLIRATLMARFGETHALVDDWYVHANSFFFFLCGVAAARFDRLFEIARKGRFAFLALGLFGYALVMVATKTSWMDGISDPVWRVFGPSLKAGQAIGMILALIGFARQYLSTADGPVRRTLTEAIFPFYIVHQTIIIVVAYNLNKLHWPVGLEAATIIAATAAGCALTYVIVRRIPLLRPLFGLSFKPKTAAS